MAHQAKKYRADPAGTRAGTGVEPARIVTSLNPQESLYKTWETFIDSLMREWKTLNIISVLLLTAILTILQIESAANDPVTRYSALLSMICAFMSLLFGCMYIIRFGSTMRTGQKAVQWAEEARSSTTGILWNIWVLLAMPATWLAWSMILYLVCIMSLVWRTGTTDDLKRGPMTPSDVLGPRIAISIVLLLGFVYFILITSTLRRYGDAMDRAWESRLNTILNEKIPETPHVSRSHAQETILVREPKPPLKRARSKTGGAAPESRIVAFNPQISFHSPDTPLEDERRTHDSDVSFESSDQNLSKEKHKAKQGKVSKRVELGDNEGLIKK
ncbi:hypothetical protein B0H34DRAFT_669162 [Crassisporium funariophilum]|nr:hypothetical protein B0H34DRAFT_669162 [Crassisporium funariophilum]